MIKEGSIFSKILSEKACFLFVAGIMAAVPLGEFITNLFGVTFVTQPIIVAVFGIYGLLLLIANIYDMIDRKRIYPTDFFCYTLLLFAVLSLVFSQNILISTTGYDNDEWIIHYIAYIALMLAATRLGADNRKKAAVAFMAVALFNSIIGTLQSFGIFITDCNRMPEYHRELHRVFVFTQHFNYYAGLSSLFTAIFVGAFIFSQKRLHKVIFFICTILSFRASMFTSARIAWVANAMVIMFYAISLFVMYKSKNDKKCLKPMLINYLFITAVFIVLVVIWALSTDIFFEGAAEFEKEIGGPIENMATERGAIWKYAFESVPKYWLFGIGFDNFGSVFTTNPKWHNEIMAFNKAHNEYIHVLATQGVFAAVNYISMLVYCIVTAVKNVLKDGEGENRTMTWLFLGMFAAYAAQACFNSSVINCAFYFWITIGLTVPRFSQKCYTIEKGHGLRVCSEKDL